MLGIFPAPKAAAGAGKQTSMRREARTRDAILNGRFAILSESCRQNTLDYQAVGFQKSKETEIAHTGMVIRCEPEPNGGGEMSLVMY